MTRKQWLEAEGRFGRHLRALCKSHREASHQDRIKAFRRNALGSSRPWALTSEEKLALTTQCERFQALLAKAPIPSFASPNCR